MYIYVLIILGAMLLSIPDYFPKVSKWLDLFIKIAVIIVSLTVAVYAFNQTLIACIIQGILIISSFFYEGKFKRRLDILTDALVFITCFIIFLDAITWIGMSYYEYCATLFTTTVGIKYIGKLYWRVLAYNILRVGELKKIRD